MISIANKLEIEHMFALDSSWSRSSTRICGVGIAALILWEDDKYRGQHKAGQLQDIRKTTTRHHTGGQLQKFCEAWSKWLVNNRLTKTYLRCCHTLKIVGNCKTSLVFIQHSMQ